MPLLKSKTILLCGCFMAAATARADNTVIVVPPDYSYLHDAGKEQAATAGRSLGDLFNGMARNASAKKTVVRAVMVVECGKAQRVTRVYGDGHMEVVSLEETAVSDTDLAEIKALYPNVQIVAGCDRRD